MLSSSLSNRAILVFFFCILIAAVAQKPTISDVDSDLKKAAAAQDAAKKAADKDAKDKAVALAKILARQRAADEAAFAVKAKLSDAERLLQTRLSTIEANQAQAKKEKDDEDVAAQKSRDELIAHSEQVLGALITAFVLWGARTLYGLVVDGRRHRVQEARINQIHTLVNSGMVAELKRELKGLLNHVTSLKEIIRLQKLMGTEPTTGALADILANEKEIAELEIKLNDLRKSTEESNAEVAAEIG